MFGLGRRGRGSRQDEAGPSENADVAGAATGDESGLGPYDLSELPEGDDVERLDLGSVRLPIPEGSQLQVEVDPAGPVRAVHLVTQVGRLTISAFAAPRSAELWPEVRNELAEQLRRDGAKVGQQDGEWGPELVADSPRAALRFVGIDGPRWMVRGVAAGPGETAEACSKLLYTVLDDTVVVRGDDPLPVRTPLPIELPESIARHIQQSQNGEQQA
ncbi:DUF3710 domain-containing protein [Saccharopolyspora gloriosae]|uniref:DUF3710 domain-containing protein n=1 Tax=Saccharopolyspora gloriosae TaxID=455344 RepID=A0A840N8F0_9PSEU|nr:DUF3710 domain-containing protein [Saccharopolyspora gloriosae]MBB5068250.1 hypothetical protein [Saccharopolyspora gloriosae]